MGRTLSAREGAPQARVRRRDAAAARTRHVRVGVSLSLAVTAALVVGIVFAGPSGELAQGIRVAGVSVGGLTKSQAVARLSAPGARLQSVPVVFVAGPHRLSIRPEELRGEPNWPAAV